MLGLNLHAIVRNAVSVLQPEEDVLLVQSSGNTNERGVIVPAYAEAASVCARIQSAANDDLKAMEETPRTEISRKAYLFSATPSGLVPAGIIRPLTRGGDLLRRADKTWWLVTAVMEDFSASGWVSVGITLQEEVPEEAARRAEEWDEARKAAGEKTLRNRHEPRRTKLFKQETDS